LRPQARTEGLVVQDLGAESLVFDRDRDIAHCLSPEAAAVWRACDGERDVAGIARVTGTDEELVADALDQLRSQGLLAGEAPPSSWSSLVSRRSALKRIAATGLAATSIPLIVSATIAAPLAHASGGIGSLCDACMVSGSGDSCGPGLVCQGGVCITQGCGFSSCTNLGMSCSSGIFSGRCTAGCSTGANLCC
jgi:hypothetical protein